MKSLEQARSAVLDAIGEPLPAEVVPVEGALGRVLAASVVATVTLPPWDNSAMDGYAIRAADAAGASEADPVRLELVGDAPAGGVPGGEVRHGSAIRIATGAPLPTGADAVVPVEQTTAIDAMGATGERGRDASGPLPAAVLVHWAAAAGAHVRRRASDLSAGDEVLAAGSVVTAAAIALAAGAGVATLSVRRRPRVAVLATGNEVRAAGTDLGPSGIPDANGPGLRALVARAGGEPIDLGIAPDDEAVVTDRLGAALAAGVDLIVVTGGVSVGPFDVVKAAFEAIGRIDLWRVAVQPGKPFVFGTAPGQERPVLLFGLPGNPVSTFVTFELFVRPALHALTGRRDVLRPLDRGVLLDEVRTATGRRAFLRATAERDADGSVRRDAAGRAILRLARGPAGQGSHVLSALAAAEALAVVSEDVEIHQVGGPVDVWWLDQA